MDMALNLSWAIGSVAKGKGAHSNGLMDSTESDYGANCYNRVQGSGPSEATCKLTHRSHAPTTGEHSATWVLFRSSALRKCRVGCACKTWNKMEIGPRWREVVEDRVWDVSCRHCDECLDGVHALRGRAVQEHMSGVAISKSARNGIVTV